MEKYVKKGTKIKFLPIFTIHIEIESRKMIKLNSLRTNIKMYIKNFQEIVLKKN